MQVSENYSIACAVKFGLFNLPLNSEWSDAMAKNGRGDQLRSYFRDRKAE